MPAGALDPAARRRALAAAASGELDLLVVGGGITGAGTALDAATRGLSVALVEARDLASGTSSALLEAVPRRAALPRDGRPRPGARGAARARAHAHPSRAPPGDAGPVPVAAARPRLGARYLGAGLVLYDTIGGARSVPRHRHLSARGARREAPALREDALIGAVQFHDAASDDAAMVVAVARTAAAHGAHIATRVRVTGLRAGAADAVDEESGRAADAARPPRRVGGGALDRSGARAGGGGVGPAHRAVEGHPRLRRRRPHPDAHRRPRSHREERPVHHPLARRLADRRHRHALVARPAAAHGHRRRHRLPAREDQRAAGLAADPRGHPRRDRGAAPVGRSRRPRGHDADQPPPPDRDPAALGDHDRGRQAHHLPRDGGRPGRRGRAGARVGRGRR